MPHLPINQLSCSCNIVGYKTRWVCASQQYVVLICLFTLTLLHLSLAQDTQQDYLDGHNTTRTEVGLPPLTWDDTVAAYAQNYANTHIGDCNLMHSQSESYGENLAGSTSDLSVVDSVKGMGGREGEL